MISSDEIMCTGLSCSPDKFVKSTSSFLFTVKSNTGKVRVSSILIDAFRSFPLIILFSVDLELLECKLFHHLSIKCEKSLEGKQCTN